MSTEMAFPPTSILSRGKSRILAARPGSVHSIAGLRHHYALSRHWTPVLGRSSMIRSGARSIGFYAFLFWVALPPAAFAKENPCLATLNWDAVSMLDPVTKWAREKGKRWSQRHPPKPMLDWDWDQIISAQAGEARAARRARARGVGGPRRTRCVTGFPLEPRAIRLARRLRKSRWMNPRPSPGSWY